MSNLIYIDTAENETKEHDPVEWVKRTNANLSEEEKSQVIDFLDKCLDDLNNE
jgi:hypothetical protein